MVRRLEGEKEKCDLTKCETIFGPLDPAGEVSNNTVYNGPAPLGHEGVLRRGTKKLLCGPGPGHSDCCKINSQLSRLGFTDYLAWKGRLPLRAVVCWAPTVIHFRNLHTGEVS